MQSRISGAIYLTFAQAILLILGWITHPLIGRLLGTASYGIYGIVLSVQSIIGLFLTLGVPMAISRYVAQDPDHAKSTLWQGLKIQLSFAFIVASVTFLASSLISKSLGDPSLTNYFRFISLVIFLQCGYPIFIQYFSGLHLFNKQALLIIIYAIIKLAGAILLIFVLDIYGAFGGFAIGGLVAALLGYYWTKGLGGESPKKLPLKSFLSFAGSYVFILFGLQLLISLDLFMVKAILQDNVAAGHYNAAVTLSRIPYLLLQGLSFVLLPSVSSLTKPGASQVKATQFISNTLRYLIAIIIPGALLAATTSKNLIILFFSSDYLPASSSLTILMIGLSSLAFFLLLANIIAGAGRPTVALLVTLLTLIISSILGYVLIPRLGIYGAAWQTAISGLVGLIILSIYTFKSFQIPVPFKSTVNIVISSCVAVIPTYIWSVKPIFLPLQYLVLLSLYVFTLFLLREIKKSDLDMIRNSHPLVKKYLPRF
jgi:stage V sporulation protein B